MATDDNQIDPVLLQRLALQAQQTQQPPLAPMASALAQPPAQAQDQPSDPLQVAAAARAVGNPNADSPPSFTPAADTTPVLAGSPGSAQTQGPPQVGRPLLLDTMQRLIHPRMVAPAPGQMARPESRLDVFESFLGNFLNAFGQGMSQSGQRGAAYKGFGAAIGANYRTAVGNYQLQQQGAANQAAIQSEQARTAQTEAQTRLLGTSVPLTLPNGQQIFVPASQLGQYLKGGYAANVKSETDRLKIDSQEKLATLKIQMEQGEVSKIVPVLGSAGQVVMRALNKFGQPMGDIPGALPPASYLPKTSSTVQWLSDGAGGFIAAPKSTTTAPALPAGLAAKVPALAAAANTPMSASTSTVPASLAQKVPALAGGGGSGRRILGSTPVIAFDAKNNQRVLTTPAEAQVNGWQQPIPVKEGDVEKYRASQVQFNDVQANVSRYRSAAQRFMREGSQADIIGINAVLNEAKIGGGIHLGPVGVEIPGYSSVAEAADRVFRSATYKSLSPAGKDLVDGYFRTMAAVPAYQKALTGIGRTNKEMLELELRNIPDPTYAPADILRKLQAFQENVDQGASGIPRMAGVPTIRDIRARFENAAPSFTIPKPFGQATQ